MSIPQNMKELRLRVLKAFDDLDQGKIDIAQASVIAKINDSIVNGLNSEIKYAILTQTIPEIPFYGHQKGFLIDHKDVKNLK